MPQRHAFGVHRVVREWVMRYQKRRQQGDQSQPEYESDSDRGQRVGLQTSPECAQQENPTSPF